MFSSSVIFSHHFSRIPQASMASQSSYLFLVGVPLIICIGVVQLGLTWVRKRRFYKDLVRILIFSI